MDEGACGPGGESAGGITRQPGDGCSLDVPDGEVFADDYLPALLARASHLISSEFHAVVRARGWLVPQWRIMACLASRSPLSTGRLAELSLIKGATATRLLDRLEADGCVQRLPHPEDRRVTLVAITDHGKARVADLIALAREHERLVLEPFGPDASRSLKSVLQRLITLHSDNLTDRSPAAD